MFNATTLYNKLKTHPDGFGCNLGHGYACFITKLISGELMISKLDSKDKDVFRKTLSADLSKENIIECLNEMLDA